MKPDQRFQRTALAAGTGWRAGRHRASTRHARRTTAAVAAVALRVTCPRTVALAAPRAAGKNREKQVTPPLLVA